MNSGAFGLIVSLVAGAALLLLGEEDASAQPGPAVGPLPSGGAPAPPFAEPEAAKLQQMIEQAVYSQNPKVLRSTANQIQNTAWSPQLSGEASQAVDDLIAMAKDIEEAQAYGSGQYPGANANMPETSPWDEIYAGSGDYG